MISYRSEKKYFIFHLALFFLVATIVCVVTMRITPQEYEQYQKLTIVEEPKGYRTEQERKDIYRQVLFVHENTRLQTRLTAQQGVFFVHQENQNPGLTENLQNITVLMQEELLSDGTQLLRYIEAHEASYDYRTNFLTTQAMTFARYRIPGHQLPINLAGLSPTLTGKATSAKISFKESGPEFHAEQLQVHVPNARM